MRKIISGDTLTQYAIIISLIAIFLVPSFISLSKNITKSLDDYKVVMKQTEDQMNKNLSTPATKSKNSTDNNIEIAAGDLSGTPENPQIKCLDGYCSIDFGEYVFNNIPQNFKEFVETSSFSGGTSTLASMLDELIPATELISDIETANLVSQLANQGHILASFEKELENNAIELLKDSNLNPNDQFIVPANSLLNGKYRTNFNKTLDLINTSFSYPLSDDEVKLLNIINFLSTEILNLADQMGGLGKDVKGNKFTTENLNAILHPDASNITNFDSTIICISGNNIDNGTSCY
ncbi:MAG: hypothetical protein AB1782_07810 [Cyanobacteriota bacterium]